MERLWALVEAEGIHVHWADLRHTPEGLLGMYYFDPLLGLPVIVLDRGLPARPRELRSVLAEEVGHHFTVPQAQALEPRFSFPNAVAQGRDEARALRWAAAFLIPLDELRAGLLRHEAPADLAERFGVTEGFLRRFLTANPGFHPLSAEKMYMKIR